jgi:carbon storage regulator
MLILSRKKGESIIINDQEVIVTLLDIKDGQVKLGFKAIKDINIDRAEIYLKKKLNPDFNKKPKIDVEYE